MDKRDLKHPICISAGFILNPEATITALLSECRFNEDFSNEDVAKYVIAGLDIIMNNNCRNLVIGKVEGSDTLEFIKKDKQ